MYQLKMYHFALKHVFFNSGRVRFFVFVDYIRT